MSQFNAKGRSPRETMATNEEDSGDGDIGLKEKVAQLENTLRIFRAEVDMKMKIIEQILNTRNEQFVHQKRILDREQSVYDSVMEHWKNTSELAVSGLSLHFSPQREDEFEDTVNYKEFHDQGTNNFHSGSARSAKSKRNRVKSPSPPLSPPVTRRQFSSPTKFNSSPKSKKQKLTLPPVQAESTYFEEQTVPSEDLVAESQDFYLLTPPSKKSLPSKSNNRRQEREKDTMEIIADYDKFPESPEEKEPNFAYKPLKAIRGKEERKKLTGWVCPHCKNYYDAIASQMEPEELQKLKNRCSRHRGKLPEPEFVHNTPQFYWRTDFPSTQECIDAGLIKFGKKSPPRSKKPLRYLTDDY